MNLFQLHAEFMRLWLDTANSMTSAALATANRLSEQMAAGWPRPFSTFAIQPQASWPFEAWQRFASSMANPPAPFANPFLAQAQPAVWPFQVLSTAPVWQVPLPTAFAPPAMIAWVWPWRTSWPYAPWLTTEQQPAVPGADLIEQVASSYRTASGYAVAAIMGPLGTALDPRVYGQPWWQTAPKRGFMN